MKFLVGCVLLSVVFAAVCAAPQKLSPEEEELFAAPDPYAFSMSVSDDEFTNYQQRQESQDENGVVRGQYSWIAPNGIKYTTTYTADAENGFQANTVEEQTNIQIRIPEPKPEFQVRA